MRMEGGRGEEPQVGCGPRNVDVPCEPEWLAGIKTLGMREVLEVRAGREWKISGFPALADS